METARTSGYLDIFLVDGVGGGRAQTWGSPVPLATRACLMALSTLYTAQMRYACTAHSPYVVASSHLVRPACRQVALGGCTSKENTMEPFPEALQTHSLSRSHIPKWYTQCSCTHTATDGSGNTNGSHHAAAASSCIMIDRK
jgi:hypothetical protein